MICRVGDRRLSGTAVSVDADLDPDRVARAVRTGADHSAEPRIEVEAPPPGAIHERVGCIHPAMSLCPRTALAAAARSLGWTTEFDDEIRALRAELPASTAAIPDAATPRRRVAESEASVERLRERVAAARGRQGAPDGGHGTDGELEAAVRELSEAETSLAAARERHRRRREAARDRRDRLEARLALRDRLGNLERRARRALVDRARGRYVAALRGVPALQAPDDPFAAPADAMALAVAKVGTLHAPAVVATGRFATAAAAADWLDAPVVHLEP